MAPALRHALCPGRQSGGQALLIALAAFGVGPGDEVLVPGYMWVSCLSAVVRLGAIPAPGRHRRHLLHGPRRRRGKDQRAHQGDPLRQHERRAGPHRPHRRARPQAGIYLLEDCAQAAGASLNGKPVGTFGDIGIFSFQLNKNLTAGDGGLLMCRESTSTSAALRSTTWATHAMPRAGSTPARRTISSGAWARA